MPKRTLLMSCILLVAFFLIAGTALWFFLSAWVPTAGKTRLIQELERRAPVTVTIGAMRYEWLGDVVLHEVQVADRRSGTVWFASPLVRLHVNWIALALRNQCLFHANSPTTVPCRTDVTVSGRYDLRTSSLSATLRTAPIGLDSLAPFARRHLPPPLAGGTVRLELRARQPARQPLELAGRLLGSRLVWSLPPARLTGDVTLEGTASQPTTPQGRWIVQGDVDLRNAEVSGVPAIGAITALNGHGEYAQDAFAIRRLTGNALGAPWSVEGTATSRSYELLVTSRAAAAPLISAAPRIASAWQAEGAIELRAVCRGPIPATGLADCLISARTQQMKLAGARLSRPIEHLAGDVVYDLLTRDLTIRDLEARLRDEPLAVTGRVTCAPPFPLSLDAHGTFPLQALTDWLPEHTPVAELDGTASLDLHVEGPAAAAQYLGRIEFHDASMAAWSKRFSAINGVLLLEERDLTLRQVALRLDDHPLTLTATVTPSPLMGEVRRDATLRIAATADLPEGHGALNGRLTPEDLIVDDGAIALSHSQARVTGRLARTAARTSELSASGILELSELSTLPFVGAPAAASWQARGAADIEATFRGRLSDWPGAALQGRLRAETLSVRSIPLEQVLCTVEQDHGTLRVRLPSAIVAGGRLAGELTVEHRGRNHAYVAQADLVGLQLERLAHAIPAWRQRSVTGQASGHTAAFGAWERRATWKGDGWLNVQGERLGDLPLLDQLFRGLFGVLADRIGLEALRRAQITQASVRWRLLDERLHTDDLRLGGMAGTEPVAVYAKGSVGLDQTLDFVIEPELSEGMLLEAPTTSTLANTVLKAAGQLERLRRLIGRHRLTGTLKKPEYRFQLSAQETLKQLAPGPADLLQGILDAVRH